MRRTAGGICRSGRGGDYASIDDQRSCAHIVWAKKRPPTLVIEKVLALFFQHVLRMARQHLLVFVGVRAEEGRQIPGDLTPFQAMAKTTPDEEAYSRTAVPP